MSKSFWNYIFSIVGTNKIADSTINGKPLIYADVSIKQTPQCVICEFIMTQLEKELKDKATDVCTNLNKTILYLVFY